MRVTLRAGELRQTPAGGSLDVSWARQVPLLQRGGKAVRQQGAQARRGEGFERY
jgi:hypothetical protein